MAEVDIKLSAMIARAGTLSASDLIYICVADAMSDTGYSSRKDTIANLAGAIFEDLEYPLKLDTTAKSIFGAINELAAGGGGSAVILTGTTAPAAGTGSDGNLYIQYTEGTGGAPDIVDAFFVKLDGEWVTVSTGGGSGTGTILYDVLEAGQTSLTFSDAAITTASIIDVYTSTAINPTNYSVAAGSITLTFAAQAANVSVAILIDARGNAGGGDSVTITPAINNGDKIADFTINNVSGSLYAPKELPTPDPQGTDDGNILIVDNGQWTMVNFWDYLTSNLSDGFWYMESSVLQTKSLPEILTYYPSSSLGTYPSDGDVIKYDGNNDEWIVGQP